MQRDYEAFRTLQTIFEHDAWPPAVLRICYEGYSLRRAIEAYRDTKSNCIDGYGDTPQSSCLSDSRWIKRQNGQNWIDGSREERTLSFPAWVSAPSRARICRLILSGRY